MKQSPDDELGSLLRELGQQERRRAPAFLETWSAASSARSAEARPSRAPLAWALGAMAAICLAGLARMMTAPQQPATPGEFATSTPSAETTDALPTDFLLTTYQDAAVERLSGEIDALLAP